MSDIDMGYYILGGADGRTPVHVDDTLEWAAWFDAHGRERIVRQETIGPYFISTVFLGLDHGARVLQRASGHPFRPLLFETMAFHVTGGSRHLEVQERCSTWAVRG